MVAICTVADEEADEGDADRARHHPQLVVRSRRRPARRVCRQIALAIRDEVGRPRTAGAGRSRSTRPAIARDCRCGSPSGRPISTGRSKLPPVLRACATKPRSTPTCAIPSSTTSSSDRRHGRRRDRSRLRARRWNCSTPSGLPLSERDRPRGLRHPFAARTGDRRNDRSDKLARQPALRRAALGSTRLRIEDPQMGRGAVRAVDMVAAARESRALA